MPQSNHRFKIHVGPRLGDLVSTAADIESWEAVKRKVRADEAAKRDVERKKRLAMGLPEDEEKETWKLLDKVFGWKRDH